MIEVVGALLFGAAFALAMAVAAWPLVARLDPLRALTNAERLAVSWGLSAWLVYVGVTVLGIWRLDAASMGGLAAAVSLLTVPGWRAAVKDGVLNDLRATVAAARGHRGLGAAWLLLLAVGLSSLVQGLAPPNDYDSLMYHLALPKRDIEVGRLTYPPHWWTYPWFPALTEHLSRFTLALAGEKPVQLPTSLFGVPATIATIAIGRRMGLGPAMAVSGGLMFLAIRMVVWQMASCEVEVALAAYVAAALVVYLAWRERGGFGLAALLGAMVGGAFCVKYHGIAVALALAPPLLWEVASRRRRLPELLAVGGAALLAMLPHLLRNALLVYSHNPFYPLFNRYFDPGSGEGIEGMAGQYGTGRALFDWLTTPWSMSVAPTYHFDGVILGAPYLLALAPLALLAGRRPAAGAVPLAVFAVVYYTEWFHLLSQQVRFLAPVMPLAAVAAAAGLAQGWRLARPHAATRLAFLAVAGVLALNQAAFVGIYAALRLPPALNLMSAEDYHRKTPTLDGAFYPTCAYVQRHLRPGERYLSLIGPHSYYCPQAAAIAQDVLEEDLPLMARQGKRPPPPGFDKVLAALEAADIRYVITRTHVENRRNDTTASVMAEQDMSVMDVGRWVGPALKGLEPLVADKISAVYDGRQVLDAMRKGRPQ